MILSGKVYDNPDKNHSAFRSYNYFSFFFVN
jgi:hypothetical protein